MVDMNPEIKKRWVEALRSGRYCQTKNWLRDSAGYCCLGVLTDLFLEEKGDDWTKPTAPGSLMLYEDFTDLTTEVQEWAGLSSHLPAVIVAEGVTARELALWNDEGGTFLEIAAAIEQGVVQ